MSATTTHNLPYKRYVAQVSTGAPRPKSTYLSLMAENLEALKACPWREAADVPVSLVDHDFTKASHFSDAYDAFKMAGAWDSKAQREVAFAGMAAYRFAIPAAAGSVEISSVTLPISRDRFLKGGVHVAAALSDNEKPSTNWSVVTGQGAAAYLANDAANIVESRPANGALTITSADLASLATTGMAYLWIYVTLEDYTDWWDQYSATEARQYAIEGSAMLVGSSASVTFAEAVAADEAATASRLVTTGFFAANVLYDGAAASSTDSPSVPSPRAHRVFAINQSCLVVVGGEFNGNAQQTNTGAGVGIAAPALSIMKIAQTSRQYVKWAWADDYHGRYVDEAYVPPLKDAFSDWYDTDAARALNRGVGVTGVVVAPGMGMADLATNNTKYFVFVSTKDALYRVGGLTVGQTSHDFSPSVVKVGDGGDLLLVSRVWTRPEGSYMEHVYPCEWHAECVSIGDGRITVGSRAVPFKGRATGLGSWNGHGSGIFIVAGEFSSVGGVPCRHVAKIDTRNDALRVEPLPTLDAVVVPNVYDNLRVIRAGGLYYVLGDFTALGGTACVKGAATFDGSTLIALSEYVVDVVGVGDSEVAVVKADRATVPVMSE